MDRQAIDRLARFCASQSGRFDIQAWLGFSEADTKAVGLAARYLSMTSWYGYEDDLAEIAGKLGVDADVSDSIGLYLEARTLGFDLSYFSAAVRLGIARTQGRSAHEMEGQATCPTWRQRRRFDRASAA